MPANRNALLRYRTIDRCLKNTGRRWTLNDLIEAVSDALYEFEGRQVDISKRTVQLDLQAMRSDKLGYNAPIEVYERKYYRYADPSYTITEAPLSEQDLSRLREVVDMLKQFSGFRQMEAFGGLVGKLRDQLGAGRTDGRRIIDFEYNANLKGLHWVDTLYELIVRAHRVRITYQSFRARNPRTFEFEPYFLKESRNRYFVLGRERFEENVLILALDRIEAVEDTGQPFEQQPGLDIDTFFQHAVGVSVSNAPPEKIVLRVTRHRAPYLITKPIHHSQRTTAQGDRFVELTLYVQQSFELEKDLLGYGDDVQVVEPISLRRRMRNILQAASDAYQSPVSLDDWERLRLSFRKNGYLHLPQLLTMREAKRIGRAIAQIQQKKHLWKPADGQQTLSINNLLNSSRLDILKRTVQELSEHLELGAKLNTEAFLKSHSYEVAPVYRQVPRTVLLIAIHQWREGRMGPVVLPGSHKSSMSKEVQAALADAPFSKGFTGKGMEGVLLHSDLLVKYFANKSHPLVLLEVDFGSD